jgi:hypothetical protein
MQNYPVLGGLQDFLWLTIIRYVLPCGKEYSHVECRPNLWIANYELMEWVVILWTAELPYGMEKYLVEFGISCVMQDKKAFEIKTTQWSS